MTSQEIDFWRALAPTPRIAVLNKADLPAHQAAEKLPAPPDRVATTSCTDGTGIEELKGAMMEVVRAGHIDSSAPSFLLNTRHSSAIRRAGEALARAQAAAESDLSTEFTALDLRVALDALGEITGQVCTDDILDRIFSGFCIGK